MKKSTLKFLVVDDSQTALADLKMKLLKIVGKESIYTARGFDEAVILMGNNDFDMAFVDLQMPDKTGMDLIVDVIQKNPKTKDLPVVVTTGYEENSLVTFTLKPYTHRFLFKPIKQYELEEAITSIIK
jgi:response regulator RpfG family c-di-GMP phosphodiesterase